MADILIYWRDYVADWGAPVGKACGLSDLAHQASLPRAFSTMARE